MKTNQKIFFFVALLLIALTFVSCATRYDRTESINFGYFKDTDTKSKNSVDGIALATMGIVERNPNGGTFTYFSYKFPQYKKTDGIRVKYDTAGSHYSFKILSGYVAKMKFADESLHLNLGLGIDLSSSFSSYGSGSFYSFTTSESIGAGVIADVQYYFVDGFFLNASAVATADFFSFYSHSSNYGSSSGSSSDIDLNLSGSIGLGIKFEGK